MQPPRSLKGRTGFFGLNASNVVIFRPAAGPGRLSAMLASDGCDQCLASFVDRPGLSSGNRRSMARGWCSRPCCARRPREGGRLPFMKQPGTPPISDWAAKVRHGCRKLTVTRWSSSVHRVRLSFRAILLPHQANRSTRRSGHGCRRSQVFDRDKPDAHQSNKMMASVRSVYCRGKIEPSRTHVFLAKDNGVSACSGIIHLPLLHPIQIIGCDQPILYRNVQHLQPGFTCYNN